MEKANHDALFQELSNVVRLAGEPEQPTPTSRQRDMSGALDMIKHAAAAIDEAQKRASEVEERVRVLMEDTSQELKKAEVRIETAEQRTQDAEARAVALEQRIQQAEERSREADQWLHRLGSTIEEAFGNCRAAARSDCPNVRVGED
jgi:chromosome segregation ATPase